MAEREIVKVVCPKCGCEYSYKNTTDLSEAGECISCGEMTYYRKIKEYIPKNPIVECPYCHSTNTKKISSISKVGSIALFGIFSAGKVAKQWHCNNCKSDF